MQDKFAFSTIETKIIWSGKTDHHGCKACQ